MLWLHASDCAIAARVQNASTSTTGDSAALPWAPEGFAVQKRGSLVSCLLVRQSLCVCFSCTSCVEVVSKLYPMWLRCTEVCVADACVNEINEFPLDNICMHSRCKLHVSRHEAAATPCNMNLVVASIAYNTSQVHPIKRRLRTGRAGTA